MAVGDYSQVEADAQAQVAAGRTCWTSTPAFRSPTSRASWPKPSGWCSRWSTCCSIDSSIVAALEAGLAVYQGKPLVNSVTGEEERLESVLPLIRNMAPQSWPSPTTRPASPRIRTCVRGREKVVDAADHGIPRADVVVDPLIMPVGALGNAGRAAFHLIRRLREELKVNTTCGASNISFGLPNRHAMNATFLAMAIGAGMTSAIMNPLHAEEPARSRAPTC